MTTRRSYYGKGQFEESGRRKIASGRKVFIPSAILAVAIALSVLIAGLSLRDNTSAGSVPAHSEGQTTLAVALLDQHHDTAMSCSAGFPPCPAFPAINWPHVPNDVKANPVPGDMTYGTFDDCPHCSAYCAPASIAMIAKYRAIGIPMNQQDDIYDHGKKTQGEIQANGAIETHGVGMTDGSGGSAWEVQDAFNWSIGPNFHQHNQSDGTKLTAAQLQQYIATGHPVLWLDHGGWPKNLSTWAFDSSDRMNQGHAKVIAGYDDNGTAGDAKDDLCLIYDPWPEYNDMHFLPANATKGPGNTFDPYWLPLNDVNLSDPTDKYLVDTFPDIPEFATVLVPIVAAATVVMVAMRVRPRRESEQ